MEQPKRHIVASPDFVTNMQSMGGPIWDKYVTENNVEPMSPNPNTAQQLKPIMQELQALVEAQAQREGFDPQEVSQVELMTAAMAIHGSRERDMVAPVSHPELMTQLTDQYFQRKGSQQKQPDFTDVLGSVELDRMVGSGLIDQDDQTLASDNRSQQLLKRPQFSDAAPTQESFQNAIRAIEDGQRNQQVRSYPKHAEKYLVKSVQLEDERWQKAKAPIAQERAHQESEMERHQQHAIEMQERRNQRSNEARTKLGIDGTIEQRKQQLADSATPKETPKQDAPSTNKVSKLKKNFEQDM